MARASLLKSLRSIHLYFGVFITPALIFFAFTGAIQTFGLHETNRDHPNYKPARWAVVLGQLHKKQTVIVPTRRQPPAPAAAAPAPGDAPSAKSGRAPDAPREAKPARESGASETAPQPTRHPLPLRIFFLIVSIGLFTSTITGLYMTYNYVRNKPLVTATLVAGVVLPLILIFV